MEKNKLESQLKQLKFALSNTVDPINVIHLEGQIKEVEKKLKKFKKTEPKEQTMASSSGSFEPALDQPIIKRKINKIHNMTEEEGEFKEATDASSSGAYDVPLFGSSPKGRKNPLKIDGPKSISKSRAVKDKKFPKWGGPKSVFIKVKEKCKKFPYCNQGDINAIEPLREEIEIAAKKYGLPISEVENIVLNQIKQIFI